MVNRIAFIGTGGTLANSGTGSRDYLSYLSQGRVLDAAEFLGLVPNFSELADLIPVPFASLRSKEIGPVQWWQLRATIQQALDDPSVDGVIVGHGTGVLEETAFFLHLTLAVSKPVVVIGAQRPPTTIGSDAGSNLLGAVNWVRFCKKNVGLPGAGVVVVMDQVVHSARGVMKLSNHLLGAMESPVSGPIARVNVDGSIACYRHALQKHTVTSEFTALELEDLPRVDVVSQYAGGDAVAIDAYVAAGARGVVVVGFPPGTNTPKVDAAIERYASAGVIFVQASRAIRDPRVLPRDGLGAVVCNNDLSPQQARILLMLSIASGYDTERIQAVFNEY